MSLDRIYRNIYQIYKMLESFKKSKEVIQKIMSKEGKT